jgi:hypothetical protein
VQVARSEGSLVFDQHGKKYIDFTAGWCVGNLGWGNEEILAAIRDFKGPTYVHPDYLWRGWAELAEGLAEIPDRLLPRQRHRGAQPRRRPRDLPEPAPALPARRSTAGRSGRLDILEECS